MRSDDDARTLREMERRLAAEDAAFVQQFEVARTPTGAVLAQIVGGLLLGGLMLLAGATAGAVAFLGAAGATGWLWWYTQEPDPPPRTGPVSG